MNNFFGLLIESGTQAEFVEFVNARVEQGKKMTRLTDEFYNRETKHMQLSENIKKLKKVKALLEQPQSTDEILKEIDQMIKEYEYKRKALELMD